MELEEASQRAYLIYKTRPEFVLDESNACIRMVPAVLFGRTHRFDCHFSSSETLKIREGWMGTDCNSMLFRK